MRQPTPGHLEVALRCHCDQLRSRSHGRRQLWEGRYTDLAIGAPMDDSGTKADAGAVTVLYGSANGLALTTHQTWTEDSRGVPGLLRGR